MTTGSILAVDIDSGAVRRIADASDTNGIFGVARWAIFQDDLFVVATHPCRWGLGRPVECGRSEASILVVPSMDEHLTPEQKLRVRARIDEWFARDAASSR